MIRFGVVGGGWRTEFFLRVAAARPDLFEVTGVTSRNEERAARLTKVFGVRVFASADELMNHGSPLFVVTSVPRSVNPEIVRMACQRGLPVLSETPPAGTVDELHELWEAVGSSGRVQIAEQYAFQPHHAARLALARSGKLGTISQAQVSAAHGYHGISLIRRFLGVMFEDATVTATSFASPIVTGPGRNGPPKQESVGNSGQLIAQFNFGDKLGVLDFTGDQYFSYIRGQRLLVRGERGEIIDQQATYLKDFRTPIRLSFERHEAGPNGNLEGDFLKGIQAGEEWLYYNPMAPAALTDDEIAIGTCLLKMAEYADGGPGFYSLGEGCQDQYLDLLSAEAQKIGAPVRSSRQPWSV